MTEKEQPKTQPQEGGQRNFSIQRIYVKDLSFETPNSPAVFQEQWDGVSDLNINSAVNKLDDDHFEVVLTITVTTKLGEKPAYLVEIQQAGIFNITGFPENEMGPMLGAYCPNILFPYARELVSDLVNRGSFPQLLLHPVNFEGLYSQHLQQKKEAEKANKH